MIIMKDNFSHINMLIGLSFNTILPNLDKDIFVIDKNTKKENKKNDNNITK